MSRATAGRGDRADLLGRDLTDLVQAQDPTVMHDMLATAPGRTTHVELTLVHADGSTTPVLASATGLDLDGSVVRCLIVADLTRRVEAEELSASEEQYRLLAENASDVVMRLSPDRRFEWMSGSVGDVLGWAAPYLDAHVAEAKELDRFYELEQFQQLTVGRELKMIELKKEIEHLKKSISADRRDSANLLET